MSGRDKFDEEHQDQDAEPSLRAPEEAAPDGVPASDEDDDKQDDGTGR